PMARHKLIPIETTRSRPLCGKTMPGRSHTPRILAIALALLGLATLTGHVLRIETLVRIQPGHAVMVINTALWFVLLGVALYLARNPTSTIHRLVHALAGTVMLIAGSELAEAVFGIELGLHWSAMHAWLEQSGHPGRMPADSAVAMLTGAAVVS